MNKEELRQFVYHFYPSQRRMVEHFNEETGRKHLSESVLSSHLSGSYPISPMWQSMYALFARVNELDQFIKNSRY